MQRVIILIVVGVVLLMISGFGIGEILAALWQ
jgi:hypothetical protein